MGAIASDNLTSVPVLVFLLGVVAARLGTDIRIPEPVYQVISIYLLFGIGLKGGVALRAADPVAIALPLALTIALGLALPVGAFVALRRLSSLGPADRGAIAAHYGSTSLVTFSAMLVFLERAAIAYEPFATTLLTAMEIPGIVAGIWLGTRHLRRTVAWTGSLREILFGRTVLLLAGGLCIGAISGPAGIDKVEPFFTGLLPGILALFLLNLGWLAGSRIGEIRAAGAGLLIFGIAFPLVAGVVGVALATAIGLSAGGAAVLGILAASAAYIAAPAAVGIALPEADRGLPVALALGVTFPWNLIVGIPLLVEVARLLEG
ncbi:MAG: sodium-dependent bicarbonate transport family permease [Chloroflexota bacterium]